MTPLRPRALPLLLLLCAAALLLQPRVADALFCGRDNCYELLSVPRDASTADIRRAYRRLSSDAHPDKNPGDEAAAARFRALSAAYEALLDAQKRAKYDDFLDNPAKYWGFLQSISTEVYAPKSNVLAVLAGIVAVATLMHWLHINRAYSNALRRVKESRPFQQELARLLKANKAASREQAENMIHLQVEGLQPPQYTDLLLFKLVKLPQRAFHNLAWHLNWFVSYNIRKLDYTTEHKLYLIQRNMHLSDQQWGATSDKIKNLYLNEQLWQPEKCNQFLKMGRTQRNRLAKGKKKTHSQPEPVNTSE